MVFEHISRLLAQRLEISRWRTLVKVQNRPNLTPQMRPVHTNGTKFAMGMLLDSENKAYGRIVIFLKIQDDGLWSKVPKLTTFDPQITFRLSS